MAYQYKLTENVYGSISDEAVVQLFNLKHLAPGPASLIAQYAPVATFTECLIFLSREDTSTRDSAQYFFSTAEECQEAHFVYRKARLQAKWAASMYLFDRDPAAYLEVQFPQEIVSVKADPAHSTADGREVGVDKEKRISKVISKLNLRS